MRLTAYILGIYQCLGVPYINPANQAPGVQTDPFLGIKSFHRCHGKTLKNHEAYSLYIGYVSMSSGPLHKSCQSGPWGPFKPLGSIQAPEIKSFHRLIMEKNF